MPADDSPTTPRRLASLAAQKRHVPGIAVRRLTGMFTARQNLDGATRLHLGSGENAIPGWVNVDLIAWRGVVPWNLTRKLPVSNGTVRFIFSEHFIEHVPLVAGRGFLSECFRLLAPTGVLRVSTPDLRKLIAEYVEGRTDEWTDVNWAPETPCQLLNEGMREWGHQFLYDEAELTRLLREVGFTQIRRVQWRESEHAELRGLESRPFHGDLILEAMP